MYQYDDSSTVSSMPAPAAMGIPGYFTDGNPATDSPATALRSDFMNMLMMEGLNLLSAAGITPSKTTNTQWTAAIKTLIEAQVGNYALDTGAANAPVVALSPPVTAYPNGLPVRFRIAHSLTGASTLNAGAGAVPLLRDDGSPTQNGDAPAGSVVSANFDAASNGFLINTVVPSQIVALITPLIQSGAPTTALAGGVANALTATFPSSLTSLANGQPFTVISGVANTGATTIAITLGSTAIAAAPIVKGNNQALAAGDIPSTGYPIELNYSSSYGAFVMQNPATGVGVQAVLAGGPQCRLTFSGGNLLLSPFRGNLVYSPGYGMVTIPSAGLPLSPVGRIAATLYYIYLNPNAGTPVLVPSTTGHVTDATGVEVMSGNNSMVLVGMEYATGPTTWAGLCRSWVNDPGYGSTAPLTANFLTSSTTPIEVNAALRVPVLLWAGEVAEWKINGSFSVGTASVAIAVAFGLDNTTPVDTGTGMTPANPETMSFSFSKVATGLSEGYHYATLLATCASGTALMTVYGSSTPGNRTANSAFVAPRK